MADDLKTKYILEVDDSDIVTTIKHHEQLERRVEELQKEYVKLARLEKQGKVSAKDYSRAVAQVDTQVKELRTTMATGGKAVTQMATGMNKSGKAARRTELAMQQAGYQFQDFVVQVQGGVNPLIAFSQQGSQLAGFFAGPWGAMIGLGIAALGSLGLAIQSAMGGAKEFEEQIKETSSSLDDYFSLLKENSSIYDDVFGKGLETLKQTSEASKDLVALARIKAFDGVKALSESLSDSVLSASFLKTSLEDVGDVLGKGWGDKTAAALGGKAGRSIRELHAALESLDEATTLEGQFEAAIRLRSIFKENVDVTGELTDVQKTFWGNLSTTIFEMEKLGLSVKANAASWTETAEAQDAARASMELYYKTEAEKQEAARARKEAVDKINSAINTEHSSLTNQILLNEAILEYGKESLEVSTLQAEIDREAYRTKQLSNGITGDNLTNLLAIYDVSVDLKAQADESVESNKKLATLSATFLSKVNAAKGDWEKLAKVNVAEGVNKAAIEASTMSDAMKKTLIDALNLVRLASDPLDAFGGAGGYTPHTKTIEDDKPSSSGKSQAEKDADRLEKFQKLLDKQDMMYGKTEAQRKLIQALGADYTKYGDNVISSLEAQIQKQLDLNEIIKKRQDLANTLEDSMSESFRGIVEGTESVKDAFKAMARDIISHLYEVLVVQQIVGSWDAKSNSGTGLTGVLMSGISGIFGSAKGNVFSGGSHVKAYADGGVVNGPTFFPMTGGTTGLMGEAGPEAIMPLRRGSDGKLGVAAQGSSGDSIVVNQTFSFSANGDESVKKIIAQAAPQIAELTKKNIMDDRRRGGSMKATFN